MSLRGIDDVRFDEPSEGLPAWLQGPVFDWVNRSLRRNDGGVKTEALTALQLAFRLEPPLDERLDKRYALNDLLARMRRDEVFALDVIDWMLHHHRLVNTNPYGAQRWSESLSEVLREGGSIWEVLADDDHYRLSHRTVGPVVEVLEHTATEATRAHHHLATAWSKLAGRNPDPSGAYREAVRAVEAVAKPIILPANDRATLGQMIAALREKPEKWTVTIGSVGDIRAQMEAVWRGQLDRHGTDDATVPLNVSPEEADAAFSNCLNLTRWFAGGHIVRAH
jgi:hypothetical protein